MTPQKKTDIICIREVTAVKKVFYILAAAALLLTLSAAADAASLFPAPDTQLIKTQTEQADEAYLFSVTSAVTAEYETQRKAAYETLLESMTDAQIAASDRASLRYPAGLLCEAVTDGGASVPVCFTSPYETEVGVSLTKDVLPALAAGGLYQNESFSFSLRMCGAVETATGYYAVTQPGEAFSFTCPASWRIQYVLPPGTDNNGNPSFILHAFGEDLLLANPVRTGCIFDGWETADGTYTDRVAAGTAYCKLYARFTPREYRVSYVLTTLPGYGFIRVANDVNPKRYTYGEETYVYDVAAPRGYVFRGWYETADFSGDPVAAIAAGRTGDVTLYAKWMTEEDALNEDLAAAHWGDLDNDGLVTAADARIALRSSVGLETLSDALIARADFAQLGKLNASCARILLRVAVGLDTMANVLKTYGRL